MNSMVQKLWDLYNFGRSLYRRGIRILMIGDGGLGPSTWLLETETGKVWSRPDRFGSSAWRIQIGVASSRRAAKDNPTASKHEVDEGIFIRTAVHRPWLSSAVLLCFALFLALLYYVVLL